MADWVFLRVDHPDLENFAASAGSSVNDTELKILENLAAKLDERNGTSFSPGYEICPIKSERSIELLNDDRYVEKAYRPNSPRPTPKL